MSEASFTALTSEIDETRIFGMTNAEFQQSLAEAEASAHAQNLQRLTSWLGHLHSGQLAELISQVESIARKNIREAQGVTDA